MNLYFKPAQSDDLDVLMTYMEDFHNFNHTEPFDRAAARVAMEMVVVNASIGRVWLIQHNQETAGYAVKTISYRLEYIGDYAFLDELYIRPEYRRQGIGSATIAFIKQTYQALNIGPLQLEVKNDNPGALALYQKLNFKSQGRQVLCLSTQQ